ncbi:MAG: hypothetical protein AAF353_00340 [Pseudomonadota bacterium]
MNKTSARFHYQKTVQFVFFVVALLGFTFAPQQPVIAQSNSAVQDFVSIEKSRGLPKRGQSKQQVLSEFGEPAQRVSPVGKPPISRWLYSEFVVYFEHHLVITTVAAEDNLPTTLVGIQ